MRPAIALVACALGCGRFGFNAGSADAHDAASLGDLVGGDRYAQAVLADEPIGYWRLDESSGTIARDLVGHHDGTYEGNCALGSAGALSSGDAAVGFDGSTCRIDLGDVLTLEGTAPFSIELWADIELTNGSVRWLVSRDSATGTDIGYTIAVQNNTLWFEQLASGTDQSYVSTSVPALDAFHHLVVTNTGTEQRIYVDGAVVVQEGFTTDQPSAAGSLAFGDYARTDSNKFTGTLDDIAFYDVALADTAVAIHFAAR